MNIETLIYVYLIICVSMILFNCVCVISFKHEDDRLEKRNKRLEEEIMKQIERMENGLGVEEKHRKYIRRSLMYSRCMISFDRTVENLLKKHGDAVRAYLDAIYPVFVDLSVSYSRKDTMKITYFAYLVAKYGIIQNKPYDLITETMLGLLTDSSLYCRENALAALYSTGECRYVVNAMLILDEENHFHHPKLLTDGLLTFSGNHQELIEQLWKKLPDFSPKMKVVILDYIRFHCNTKQKEILEILADSNEEDEVRFSCIRYFGRYPYEMAYPLLLDFTSHPEQQRWEYAAISATALASYPGEHTIEVLKECLSNSNWYIRLNAAVSLEKFHLSYTDLIEIFDGNDRYAREILQYRMDLEDAKKKTEVSTV